MRHYYFNLGILALGLVVILQISAFPQKSKKYPSRTLAEIISLNRDGTDQTFAKVKLDEKREFIGMDPMNSTVKLQFVDGPQMISKSHLSLINWWGKLQQIDKKFLQFYTDEFLFSENGVEYWIPVQTKDKDAIASKFHSGDTIILNVLYVGAGKEKDKTGFNSLFLSTGFQP